MKRVMLIFGTRPEAVKMAPLVQAMRRRPAEFHCSICISAQHRQMLDQAMALFGIRADYDLDIMRPGQNLYDVTAAVLSGLRDVFRHNRPDAVLVQGDTTTAFVGALAAFYERIPIGHVEAGLRTNLKYSPYPEEINRQLVSRLADWHFAPTSLNAGNLVAEGVDRMSIFVTGNTVIDALHQVCKRIYADHDRQKALRAYFSARGPKLDGRRTILVTGHRRESFGEGFIGICSALRALANEHPDVDIVYPVHLNPNVQEPVRQILGAIANVYLLDPLDYEPFVFLMNESYIVLTDSGGVQEEGPSLGKPVLVMRESTERPEAVQAGTVKLVGTHTGRIVAAVNELLRDGKAYREMAQAVNPYGDGQASDRILEALLDRLHT